MKPNCQNIVVWNKYERRSGGVSLPARPGCCRNLRIQVNYSYYLIVNPKRDFCKCLPQILNARKMGSDICAIQYF